MQGEIFGVGRTWLMAALILVATTTLYALGKMEAEMWKEILVWVFSVAGGKSAIVGVAGAMNKQPKQGG